MTLKKILVAFVAALTMTTANAADKNNSSTAVSPSTNNQTEFVYYEGEKTSKYVYSLDEQGRVSSKVRYTLNNKGKWMPSLAYSVFYGENETIVTCAGWNSNAHSFNKNAKQIHLDSKEYPVVFHMPK